MPTTTRSITPRSRARMRAPARLFILIALCAFGATAVRPATAVADNTYSACDYVPASYNAIPFTSGTYCQSMGSGLTLYGFSNVYRTPPAAAGHYACVKNLTTNLVVRAEAMNEDMQVGLDTYVFTTPVAMVAGHDYQMFYRSASDCSGGSFGASSEGDNTTPNTEQTWYFSEEAANTAKTGLADTRIVDFTYPALFATTTSPVGLKFTYSIGTTTPWASGENFNTAPVGYVLGFRNQVSGIIHTTYGTLPSNTVGFHTHTATTTLESGTWSIIGILNNWTPTLPIDAYDQVQYRDATTIFGVDYNDNIQTVTSFTPVQQTFASTSCHVNFLGTFNFSDCIGYLVVPTTGSTSPILNLKNISLAGAFPFAYLYQIPQLRNSLFNGSTTASTTVGVDIPWFGGTEKRIDFLSKSLLASVPLAAQIKTILGLLLWFMLAELIYFRAIRAHDKETPV